MNLNHLKDSAISFLLTNSGAYLIEDILTSITGFKHDDKTVKAFRRELANWKNEFNKKQTDNIAAGKIKKENGVLILSTKGGGYFAAKNKEDVIKGYRSYVETLKSEAETARNMARFIELAWDQRLQHELNFEKEPIKQELF